MTLSGAVADDLIARGFPADAAYRVESAIDSGVYVPGGDFAGTVRPDGLIQVPDAPRSCSAWDLTGCLPDVPWFTVALYAGLGLVAVALLTHR